MKPERMLNLTLLCRNEDREQVIAHLAQLKLLHIVDHKREQVGASTIDIGAPLASAEDISGALIMTRNLLAKLRSTTPPAEDGLHLSNRLARIKELARSYSEHEQAIDRLHARIQDIDGQRIVLEQLPPDEPLAALKARSTHSALLKAKRQEIIAALTAAGAEPLYTKENGASVFITVQKKDAHLLDAFEHIDIEQAMHAGATARTAASALTHERRVLEAQAAHHTKALESFAPHCGFLRKSEEVLALELLKAEAPLHFGATRNLTLIKGFVPARRAAELEQALTGVMTISELTPAHEAPTALNNPRSKGFESLIELYTLPKYNEIDPTSLMAITFPLFFGFMLGDIGYGIVALIAAWLLKRHVPAMRSIGSILVVSAIATIAFGFVYGEFFGTESLFGLMHLSPLLHRAEDIMLMFGIAIGIGALHLNFGLVLGMINEWKDGPAMAIIKKGSWMLLQLGAVLLAAAYGMLPFDAPLAVAWTALIMAIAGIGYGERVKGLLELPMIFSNMLSYTRLVALGLASVYLAFVINQIAGDLFAKGGPWIVLGAIILLVGHTINLLLGLLGPFLHALRLHYVEFFTKFYEGGGKQYTPFGQVNEA